MVRKQKKSKKKRSFSIRTCIILSSIVFVLASLVVYYFSFDSRTHVLSSSGNYYYTDKQIYQIADVSTDTRLWLTPGFLIENRLESNPLIADATVHKSQNKISFDIEEKVVIGYYVQDNKNYLLTIDNESIELDTKYLKTIVHFPLLSDFNESQRKEIAKQFKKNAKSLSRSVIEKIAEMVPFQTSYDDNMIKMTMQDGNIVYTSMDSLVMMANYQAMLTELHGQNACLLLDAQHSAIDKIDCADIGSLIDGSTNAKDEAKEEDQNQNTEENQQETTDTSQEITENTQSVYDQATDWTINNDLGLEYSASLDVYRDPNTGLLYRWNAETASYDQIVE